MRITADGRVVPISSVHFKNGEQRVTLESSVAGQSCTIVESLAPDPDSRLVRLLLTIDALRENGASHVRLVMPWMAYSLQNRHFDGEAVSARAVARAISGSGVDEVVLVDIHAESCLTYFTVPVTNFSPLPQFVEYVTSHELSTYTVVGPDKGSHVRARELAKMTGTSVALLTKKRDTATLNVSDFSLVEGELGETCLLVDDAVNSGSTIVGVSRWLRTQGVKKIVWCVTHFLGVPGSLDIILPEIDLLITTDSVEHGLKTQGKIVVVPLRLS